MQLLQLINGRRAAALFFAIEVLTVFGLYSLTIRGIGGFAMLFAYPAVAVLFLFVAYVLRRAFFRDERCWQALVVFNGLVTLWLFFGFFVSDPFSGFMR